MRLYFIKKWHETADAWSFLFVPKTPLTWIAGQSLRLEIPGPYGSLEHRFSIASAPSSATIIITTRLSGSDYKDSLAALQPGGQADAYAVEGNVTWRTHKNPHIFVAAGIGITPLHAMLAERKAQQQPLAATLLYGNHDNQFIFEPQLKKWHRDHPEFTVQYHGGQRLGAGPVLALPNAYNRLIYISGASKMVGTLSADLIAAGIPAPHILRDQFTGRLPLDDVHPQM